MAPALGPYVVERLAVARRCGERGRRRGGRHRCRHRRHVRPQRRLTVYQRRLQNGTWSPWTLVAPDLPPACPRDGVLTYLLALRSRGRPAASLRPSGSELTGLSRSLHVDTVDCMKLRQGAGMGPRGRRRGDGHGWRLWCSAGRAPDLDAAVVTGQSQPASGWARHRSRHAGRPAGQTTRRCWRRRISCFALPHGEPAALAARCRARADRGPRRRPPPARPGRLVGELRRPARRCLDLRPAGAARPAVRDRRGEPVANTGCYAVAASPRWPR
jgi:hypothetical protein